MPQRKPEASTPNAIQPMAVLPVFFDLNNKPVLFAGFGEGADWKLELLLAAGAEIHLCTTNEVEIPNTADLPGCVFHERRDWQPSDFAGKALALGALDDDDAAHAFAAAARDRGIPVNVIDNKPLCDFQFGSIVNRSPVVVSISTSGAAPALGQAIRLRIESLLPLGLGTWAAIAQKARRTLKQRFRSMAVRKDIWRSFAEAALTRPVEEARDFFDRVHEPRSAKGQVTLVGAGPGAADLLTLRAVRAMQAADVILFDDLVSDEVLDLARREAKRMLVGKRGHRASCRQEDINALMIKLSKQGKRVVRLKSGDPMIFGRGGEELDALHAENIAVDVVPGVTTALAAASQLGVSLTHRDAAQSVKFVTGHSRKGALPDLDWRACADPSSTLMVYMGGRTAPKLAQRLLDEGLDEETPVMVCVSVSQPGARTEKLTLGGLRGGDQLASGPVLLGIGQVFASAQSTADTSVTSFQHERICRLG